MTRKAVDAEKFEVVQTGKVRFEIKPRAAVPAKKAGWQEKAAAKEAKLAQQLATANANAAARAKAKEQPAASEIDTAAHEAATSPTNDLAEPTEAQAEAGNYKKGHITVQGLDIAVENPRGSTRSGKRPDGTTWSHEMSDHYGYVKRTVGADNEQIDVYVGPKPESDRVYVVDQLDQESGKFDEHKAMVGFASQEEAVAAYSSNFDKGWKVGPVKEMSADEFKGWLKDGDTTKPAAEPQGAPQNIPKTIPAEPEAAAEPEAQAAPEPDIDDAADIPKAFLRKVKVPMEVWVADEGKYETIEIGADKALASVREDIVNLRSLIACMKG